MENFVNIEKIKAKERILKTIAEHEMFSPGDRIIMGLSGGPDSMCLFDVLLQVKDQLGIELEAVHINHKFRPGDAEDDQKFVENYCDAKGINCNSFTVDCNELAMQYDLTSEEAGRKARYDSFALVAGAVQVMGTPRDKIKIVVAHNRNDQAETVLFRIIRGTGTDGLTGMEYKYIGGAGYEILRPLLDTDRRDILSYCEAYGLDPRMDHTNEEAIYGRNKIRLKVIPGIDEIMESDVTDAVLRLRDTAAEDKKYMKKVTETAYAKVLDNIQEPDSRRLSRSSLAELDDAVRHRVILKAFDEMGLDKDIGRVHLLAADDLIASDQASGSLDFPKGYVMRAAYDSIWITNEGKGSVQSMFDQLAEKFGMTPEDDEKAAGRSGYFKDKEPEAGRTEADAKGRKASVAPRFRAKLMSTAEFEGLEWKPEEWGIEQDASLHNDPREVFKKTLPLDAEKVFDMPADEIEYSVENIHAGDSDEPENRIDIICVGITKSLLLRQRRNGDFININAGRKSLQDLYVDMKIPRHMRDDIPVVACGSEVLWIPDIPESGKTSRFAEKYSVSKETKRVLLLEMIYEL